MLYLDSSIITIPNLLNIESEHYTLELKNNVTNETVTRDASNISDNELYYQFIIDASGMANNEYTVSLYDDSSQCLGKYLAQKGIRSDVKRTSFENDTKYIQFQL